MNPEFPRIDQDKTVSPHAQEVEFALILSRMISTVKEDPTQLRLMVYEFARTRLRLDTALLDGPERRRLTEALETAIQGVDQFSARRDEKERLQPPPPAAQIGPGDRAQERGAPQVDRHGRRGDQPPSGKPARHFEERGQRPVILRCQTGRTGLVHAALPDPEDRAERNRPRMPRGGHQSASYLHFAAAVHRNA